VSTDNGRTPSSPDFKANNPKTINLSAGKKVFIVLQDSGTNTPSTVLKLRRGTTGTPIAAAGAASAFAGRVELELDDAINNSQIAAVLNWYWRAVGSNIGADSGVLSVMVQSSGTLKEVLRINDYSVQLPGGSTTNPGHSFPEDNRHGMGLDGSGRVFLGHTSLPFIVGDTVGGIPRIGVLENANAPVPVAVVGANITNNVTSGGSANVINNITAASGDATAAKLTDTRDAIFRLTQEVSMLKAQLKLVGYCKT